MHGRDITPLLENPEAKSDHTVLMAYTARSYGADTNTLPAAEDENSNIPWWTSYRKDNYKYIVNLIPGEIDELYDLTADPDEITNLAFYPEYQKTVVQLRRELLAELRRTDCPFVEQIPQRAFAIH